MRNLSQVLLARLVCACVISSFLAFGVVGCGGGSGAGGNTSGELPPEAKAANKNMEDFMKTPPKK